MGGARHCPHTASAASLPAHGTGARTTRTRHRRRHCPHLPAIGSRIGSSRHIRRCLGRQASDASREVRRLLPARRRTGAFVAAAKLRAVSVRCFGREERQMSQRARGHHHHLRFATAAAAHWNLERALGTRGLKQLAPLGITASHGGSYLASYGNERGRMWQKFLATLEEAHRHVQADAVASAALCAFNAARCFLTKASCATAAPNVAPTSSVAISSTTGNSAVTSTCGNARCTHLPQILR